jgi:hypothetical protein
MWILKFLPDWFFYAVLLMGTLGILFSRFIPAYYRTATQSIAVLFFVFGTFMSGVIYDNNWWKEKVAEMEAKVAKAEQESKEANDKLDQYVSEKNQRIEERQVYIKQYIEREVAKYDDQVILPIEFIRALNSAAEDIE